MMLLAVIAGGLRGLLRGRGEPIDGVVLPIFVPMSRRGPSGQDRTANLISQMVIPVPLGIADPGQRLKQIAVETAKRKAISRPSLGTMFQSRLVRGAMAGERR
jgi:diacylglycerol O-acyltransferase / wax synthase